MEIDITKIKCIDNNSMNQKTQIYFNFHLKPYCIREMETPISDVNNKQNISHIYESHCICFYMNLSCTLSFDINLLPNKVKKKPDSCHVYTCMYTYGLDLS